jgi:hypothetical protein
VTSLEAAYDMFSHLLLSSDQLRLMHVSKCLSESTTGRRPVDPVQHVGMKERLDCVAVWCVILLKTETFWHICCGALYTTPNIMQVRLLVTQI